MTGEIEQVVPQDAASPTSLSSSSSQDESLQYASIHQIDSDVDELVADVDVDPAMIGQAREQFEKNKKRIDKRVRETKGDRPQKRARTDGTLYKGRKPGSKLETLFEKDQVITLCLDKGYIIPDVTKANSYVQNVDAWKAVAGKANWRIRIGKVKRWSNHREQQRWRDFAQEMKKHQAEARRSISHDSFDWEIMRQTFKSLLEKYQEHRKVNKTTKLVKKSLPMKNYMTTVKQLGVWLQQTQRRRPAQALKMMIVFARLGGNYNVGSLFESKAGLKPAKTDPLAGEVLFGTVQAVASVKSALKSVNRDSVNNEMVLFPINDEDSAKTLEETLCKVCEPSMLTSQTLPKDGDWHSNVYMKQAFGAHGNWVHVGMPHMCLMEVRILFSGRETVFGFPYDAVPGSSAKEKQTWLAGASADDLGTLARSGFCVTHDRTEAIMVPPGFMLIYFAPEATTGVRFFFFDIRPDASVQATRQANIPEY